MSAFNDIERNLKACQNKLDVELREKDKLETKLKEQDVSNSNYGQNELTTMIAESKKIHAIVEQRDGWQDLYKRLKQLIHEVDQVGVQMDNANYTMQDQLDAILNDQNE